MELLSDIFFGWFAIFAIGFHVRLIDGLLADEFLDDSEDVEG